MKKKAEIYRMVTPDHLCPWGVKGKDLLERNGFQVEDHHLESMDENREYKETNGYSETPQIFIEGRHLGGYDQLREFLGKEPDPKEGDTYQPIAVVYAVALALGGATTYTFGGEVLSLRALELGVAFMMGILATLKLQDLNAFATGFVQYDLVARRYVPYAYFYALVEAVGGVLMVARWGIPYIAPLVLVVSVIGAVSVVDAAFIRKRDVNCACVGGGSKVPLGFFSLLENLLMAGMAVWMLWQRF